MLYKGEGVPRGYEIPTPQSHGGGTAPPEIGPHERLPQDVLKRIHESVRPPSAAQPEKTRREKR